MKRTNKNNSEFTTPLKDLFSMLTAAVMIGSGAAMSVYSLVCYGDIRTGVLFYVAQAPIYAGTLLGVSVYWNAKVEQALREMQFVLSLDAQDVVSEAFSDRQPVARSAAQAGGADRKLS